MKPQLIKCMIVENTHPPDDAYAGGPRMIQFKIFGHFDSNPEVVPKVTVEIDVRIKFATAPCIVYCAVNPDTKKLDTGDNVLDSLSTKDVEELENTVNLELAGYFASL
jgi:hypothetical protein